MFKNYAFANYAFECDYKKIKILCYDLLENVCQKIISISLYLCSYNAYGHTISKPSNNNLGIYLWLNFTQSINGV